MLKFGIICQKRETIPLNFKLFFSKIYNRIFSNPPIRRYISGRSIVYMSDYKIIEIFFNGSVSSTKFLRFPYKGPFRKTIKTPLGYLLHTKGYN